MIASNRKNIARVLLFVALGSLPWWGVSSLSQFFMFVPLLLIQRDLKGEGVMKWWIWALVLWNLSTLWWIGKATIIGPIAATFATTTLFSVVLSIYNRIWRRATLSLSYTVLVSSWIAAEWLYTKNEEISFPWLNLGNGFSLEPYFVQWYEYSGIFGGTLWVLIVNIILFEAIKNMGKLEMKTLFSSSKFRVAILLIIIPIICSLFRYFTYVTPEGDQLNVAIIQPNVDPYNEKFEEGSHKAQEQRLLDLAAQTTLTDVDFFVAPETALDNDFAIESLKNNSTTRAIRSLLRDKYADATFITGLVTVDYFPKGSGEVAPPFTARTTDRLSFYYDIHNSAVAINLEEIDLYHKSRLAIGVEMTPFYKYTKQLGDMFVDLGGAFGMYGAQEERTNFTSVDGETTVGTAICFEAVYGEFFSEFVRNGAEAMFVISNDGWWGDTPGYHHLLRFASLRAIETRRDIARSANTGISAFISSRGDIIKQSSWDEMVVLDGVVTTNDKITTYVKYGDFIARICAFISVLSILYSIAYHYKRKNHLV